MSFLFVLLFSVLISVHCEFCLYNVSVLHRLRTRILIVVFRPSCSLYTLYTTPYTTTFRRIYIICRYAYVSHTQYSYVLVHLSSRCANAVVLLFTGSYTSIILVG